MRKTLVSTAVSAGVLLLGGTPISATPVTTGCPTGYEAKTLDEWAALNHEFAPPFIDASGNGDGVVCGLALPDGFRFGRFITALDIEPHADVLYLFTDNDSPAYQ
jgi:hypothetical protein